MSRNLSTTRCCMIGRDAVSTAQTTVSSADNMMLVHFACGDKSGAGCVSQSAVIKTGFCMPISVALMFLHAEDIDSLLTVLSHEIDEACELHAPSKLVPLQFCL